MVARRREPARRRDTETPPERWQRVSAERRSLIYGPLPSRERCVELLEHHERQVIRERDWARFCISQSARPEGAEDWTPLVFVTFPDLDPTGGVTRSRFYPDAVKCEPGATRRRK